jgi:hypothetical protein
MPSIVVLAGSPSATSRTAAVLDLLALRLTSHGHEVHVVPIRELPPGPLLAGRSASRPPASGVGGGSVLQLVVIVLLHGIMSVRSEAVAQGGRLPGPDPWPL